MLNEGKQNYFSYDKQFYAIVQALNKCRHYLIPREFILYSNNHALQYITQQPKLSQKHAKWVEFFQSFTFVLNQICGSTNKFAYALSRGIWFCRRLKFKLWDLKF